jgi:anti-anti-sigma regulatory factor
MSELETPMHTVTLSEQLDVRQVAAEREQLRLALEQRGPIAVDASKVAQVDTAGAQLLVAFARAALSRGREVSWARSATLEEFLSRTALLSALEHPVEM